MRCKVSYVSRRRRFQTTRSAKSIAKATGLTVTRVRAVLRGEDVPVVDMVKVGGFLGLTIQEMHL